MRNRTSAFWPHAGRIIAVGLALLPAVWAQAPLTLQQAVHEALRNSPRLRVAAAEQKKAHAGAAAARAGRLPRIDVQEDLTRSDNPVYVFSTLLSQHRFAQAGFALPALNQPAPLNNFQTRAEVSIPIFDARQRELRMREARLGEQVAGDAAQQVRQGVLQAHTVSGFSTVTTPFDGEVTQKTIDAGALAMPGMALLTLERPDQLQLAVSVPDALLGSLHVGQKVTAQVDTLPDKTFWSRISEITPVSDPTARAAVVKIDLPATTGLRSGGYGHITLPAAGPVQAGVMVPRMALLHQGELDEMYVLNAAGRAELRRVKTGTAAGNLVEILAGLNPGERYAVDAQAVLAAAGGRTASCREGLGGHRGLRTFALELFFPLGYGGVSHDSRPRISILVLGTSG